MVGETEIEDGGMASADTRSWKLERSRNKGLEARRWRSSILILWRRMLDGMVGEDMRTERVFLSIRHLLLCQKLIKGSREHKEYWI